MLLFPFITYAGVGESPGRPAASCEVGLGRPRPASRKVLVVKSCNVSMPGRPGRGSAVAVTWLGVCGAQARWLIPLRVLRVLRSFGQHLLVPLRGREPLSNKHPFPVLFYYYLLLILFEWFSPFFVYTPFYFSFFFSSAGAVGPSGRASAHRGTEPWRGTCFAISRRGR